MVSTSLQNESRQSLSGCCSWSWEGSVCVLGACSAAIWSFGLAQGSTLISVGLGSLVQTYTHVKKSHACMQTNEQKHKDTYKQWRDEDRGDAGRMNQPGEPREMEKQKEWDGGRAGVRREMARAHTKGVLYCSCKMWPAGKVPCRSTRCHCNNVNSAFLRVTPPLSTETDLWMWHTNNGR